MSVIISLDSHLAIPLEHFQICLIDNLKLSEICKLYTYKQVEKTINQRCTFKIGKFIHHLKVKHNINLIEYCKKYLKVEWPLCPITGLERNFAIKEAKDYIHIRNYHITAKLTKENSPKFRAACEKFSIERRGEENPMFQKIPWNFGLDISHPSIKKAADERRGIPMSKEQKKKLSEIRLANPAPRHVTPHTQESKNKMREHTAKMWAEGRYNVVTSIHKKMRVFLEKIGVIDKFIEEFQEIYYSIDFACPELKIAIECDGDYYHCNPQFFPNGPKDKIQKRNAGRDKSKNTFLTNRGWKILRFWECEINSGIYEEKLIDSLKNLGILKK